MSLFSQMDLYLAFYILLIKADLLARYGGVAPKMAEEAHALVIDKVPFFSLLA